MEIEKDIRQLKETIDSHEKRIKSLEELFSRNGGVKERELSISEFLLSKKPKGDVNKTLAIAYYQEIVKGANSFSIAGLETGFKEARAHIPDNLNDKVNKNIRKGFIKDFKIGEGGKKNWVLTSSGVKYVENNFKASKEKS